MVSDRIYELCQPVLDDEDLGDEEKTDKLEDVLSSAPASLKGKALEDAVLGALWRWKGEDDQSSSNAWRKHHSLPLACSLAAA
jgi:hypothetical protein